MYTAFTPRKILALSAVVLVMTVAVSTTITAKKWLFGSTPFIYSFELAAIYVLDSVRAEVAHLSRRALAGAAFARFGAPTTSAASGQAARAVPVLTYHRIVSDMSDVNNVTKSLFADQMQTLYDAGWRTITLEEFQAFLAGEHDLPEKSFLIAFDDGAKDSFYPVDPIFRALGFEGVSYIIVEPSKTRESTYYLAPEEIRRMLATGRWEIGSHSYDGHRPYAVDAQGAPGIFFSSRLWLPNERRVETPEEFKARVRDDLARSKAELETTYDVPIETFAFPFGNETNIDGVENFPEGAHLTVEEAARIYEIGFVQTDTQKYSYNYPGIEPFLARRIHVHHDWDGARLLRELEKGAPKTLPFEDDFADDRGWLPAWGSLERGRNNLVITADPGASSASTFLDGSALWDDYSFDAALTWESGHVLLLADVVDAKTYDACAFGDGVVRIQSTSSDETRVLAEARDERMTYGENVQLGIRVHDSVIECLWNYGSVVEAYERDRMGGVGIQIWNPALGTAQLQVSAIIVRPFTGATSTAPF